MVKENWSNKEPSANNAVISAPGSTAPAGLGSESKSSPSVQTHSKTPLSSQAAPNPWGDYISKQNFIDMHFC
ncbi:hypothetical protein BpHYR1_015676 [Brachionus plicatilis]|uniref:Uncharacterized protein n=1 Tax=Brachionus plicatilis TaxID=10195 RepID=A0A3M7S2A0_BRAPC|nr:hypothetical protein BpHYR1_015676 [Brachionus plicatilis]